MLTRYGHARGEGPASAGPIPAAQVTSSPAPSRTRTTSSYRHAAAGRPARRSRREPHGMLLQAPGAVVAADHHHRELVPDQRVGVHQREAAAPSPSSSTTCAEGPGQPGRDRVAQPGAEAAERPRVQPPARPGGLDVPARERDEVAAVTDDHRVLVQYREQFAVDPGRMHRLGLAGQQRHGRGLRGLDRLGQPPAQSSQVGLTPAPSQPGEERRQVPGRRPRQRQVLAGPARRVSHVHHARRSIRRTERPYPSLKSSGVPATMTRSASRSATERPRVTSSSCPAAAPRVPARW